MAENEGIRDSSEEAGRQLAYQTSQGMYGVDNLRLSIVSNMSYFVHAQFRKERRMRKTT